MSDINENVPINRPVTFKKVYATNVMVAMTQHDLRVEFFNEKYNIKKPDTDDDDVWVYMSESMVLLTPLAAKRLKNALSRNIKRYEDLYGKIKEDKTLPLFHTSIGKQKK